MDGLPVLPGGADVELVVLHEDAEVVLEVFWCPIAQVSFNLSLSRGRRHPGQGSVSPTQAFILALWDTETGVSALHPVKTKYKIKRFPGRR